MKNLTSKPLPKKRSAKTKTSKRTLAEDFARLEIKPIPRTTLDQVAGCLKYDGPPVSIEEMDAGLHEMFRRWKC